MRAVRIGTSSAGLRPEKSVANLHGNSKFNRSNFTDNKWVCEFDEGLP